MRVSKLNNHIEKRADKEIEEFRSLGTPFKEADEDLQKKSKKKRILL